MNLFKVQNHYQHHSLFTVRTYNADLFATMHKYFFSWHITRLNQIGCIKYDKYWKEVKICESEKNAIKFVSATMRLMLIQLLLILNCLFPFVSKLFQFFFSQSFFFLYFCALLLSFHVLTKQCMTIKRKIDHKQRENRHIENYFLLSLFF